MGLILSNTATKEDVESLPNTMQTAATPQEPKEPETKAIQFAKASGEVLKLSTDAMLCVCSYLDLTDIYNLISITCRCFSQIFNAKENDFIWKFDNSVFGAWEAETITLSRRELALRYLIPTTVCDLTLTLHGPAVITSLKELENSQAGFSLKLNNRHLTNRYRLPFTRYSRSRRNPLCQNQVQIFTHPFPTPEAVSDPRFKEEFNRIQQTLAKHRQMIERGESMNSLNPRMLIAHSVGYFEPNHENFTCQKKAGDYHYQQFIEPNTTIETPSLLNYDPHIHLKDGTYARGLEELQKLFKQYKVLYFRVVIKASKVDEHQLTRIYPDEDESISSRGWRSHEPFTPPAHEKPFTGGYLFSNILRVELNEHTG